MHQFSDKTAKWPFQQTTVWGIRFHNECLSPAGVRGRSTGAAAAKSTRRVCFPPPGRIQPLHQPRWALRHHLSVAQFSVYWAALWAALFLAQGFFFQEQLCFAGLLHGSCRPPPPVPYSHCPMGSSPHPKTTLLRLELLPSKAPLAPSPKPIHRSWGDTGFPSSLAVDFWRTKQADSNSEHISSKHVMLRQRLTNSDENLSSQPAIPRKQETEAALPNAVIFFTHFKSSH